MKEKLSFCYKKNGVAVFDVNRIMAGDYRKVAHINYDRTVEFYVELSPQARQLIETFARHENAHPIDHPEIQALRPLENTFFLTTEHLALLAAVKNKNLARITMADADPRCWYELFITQEEQETHTIKEGSTFEKIIEDFGQYADQYGLDRINIDIWRKESGNTAPFLELCPAQFMYDTLKNHLSSTKKLDYMKMVGTVTCQPETNKLVFTKEHAGEGKYFADEIALRYFRDRVCYIGEHSESEDPENKSGIIGADQGYTRSDLVELCEGDEEKAIQLFGILSWEDPLTLLMDWPEDN